MKSPATTTAMMSAMPLPDVTGAAEAPEWVHLLPAGDARTQDGRGPYVYPDLQSVIAASFARSPKIPLDENHATERAPSIGAASPARGYIVEMEAREDGLWGRVDWTNSGRALMEDRAYLGLSPVLLCAKSDRKTVVAIKSVALTNNPNLLGIAQLNDQETEMEELVAKLKGMLGLSEDDDTDKMWSTLHAVLDAAAAEKAQKASMAEAQTALAGIAKALGQPEDITPEALVEAAQSAQTVVEAGDNAEVITELQTQLAEVSTELNTLKSERAHEKAVAFVDGAMAKGAAITAKLRDRYISMHTKDPEGTEELIDGLPRIGGLTHTRDTPPGADGVVTELNDAQREACRLLGQSEEKYLATINARAKEA